MPESAIDTTPDGLYQEITAAETERDKALKDYETLVKQYAGEEIHLDDQAIRMPENLTYEWLSFIVPKIVMHNPRTSVTSRRKTAETVANGLRVMLAMSVSGGEMEIEEAEQIFEQVRKTGHDAMAVQHGLNRWCAQNEYYSTLDRACYHTLMAFCALKSRVGPDPNDAGLRWPVSDLVPPERLLIDPACLHYKEALWLGDWRIESKKRLKQIVDEGGPWKKKAVDKIASYSDENLGLQRDEIRVYEIWVPDHESDPGELDEHEVHGTLFTVGAVKDGDATRGEFLRDPRPYYGPRWGPYAMFGVYANQTTPYPMSPLLATFSQQKELQMHIAAMNRNAQQYKRLVLVSDKNPNLANDLRDQPDMFVITVEDEQFDKDQVVTIEVAGVPDQQIKHFELFKQRWDRIAGMDDAQRGAVAGKGTATEHAIADDASKIRTDYMEAKFTEGVRNDLKTKAWYMTHDERIRFRLGPEAGEAFGMLDPIYVGGIDDDSEFSFDDLEIDIEPYSMPRTGEALMQKRVLDIFQLLTSAAPMMIQYPHIDWRKLVDQIGEAHNMPHLSDTVDFDMVKMMGQQMMEGGSGPQQMSSDGLRRQEAERPANARAGMMGGLARGAVR